jgi:hypothetical protein
MKRSFLKTLGVGVAALMTAGLISVQAAAITGNITFTGGVTLDTGSAGTATKVLTWVAPVVLTTSGSFVGTVGPVAFFSPWSFNSGAISTFWSVGGFTFDLASSAIQFQGGTPPSVSVGGTGTIHHGADSATGTWAFSTQDPAAGGPPPVFSFSASTGVASVPDGGLTMALLGFALVGIEGLRRKMVK